MRKQTSTAHFKAMEDEAYHACLEWPIWLVLREKELSEYLAGEPAPVTTPEQTPPRQPKENK